jgi:hypothetical protein
LVTAGRSAATVLPANIAAPAANEVARARRRDNSTFGIMMELLEWVAAF